jgi:sugar/nucleoside kinase (ribokinase family)
MDEQQKRIIGIGLIGLDAVTAADGYHLFAAGSCVNVLVILHALGWDAQAVGMIGQDVAADYVFRDLQRFRFNTDTIFRDADTPTPIYVQTFTDRGHVFRSQCPHTGRPFPKYQPMKSLPARQALERLSTADVLYVERVNPVTLEWVRRHSRQGTRIYFEPNRIDDKELYREIAACSQVVKYSDERRAGMSEITDELPIPLEIMTLGNAGMQFRMTRMGRRGNWVHVPPVVVCNFRDAAGAGDWLSAFFIDGMMDAPPERMTDLSFISTLLQVSQQASAYNCAFTGARGMQYPEAERIRVPDLHVFD